MSANNANNANNATTAVERFTRYDLYVAERRAKRRAHEEGREMKSRDRDSARCRQQWRAAKLEARCLEIF